MVWVITTLESAQNARRQLALALKKLAEAQVEVSEAAETLAMFEHNLTTGHFKDVQPSPSTITRTGQEPS